MTRFWNWQDSPIPFAASEIAPVEMTSRGATDDLKPGQLGAPVVSIVNPTPLPDPTGMAAVLQAIQNGNMFRDMSGLAATMGLAQAGINAASQGATAAGAQPQLQKDQDIGGWLRMFDKPGWVRNTPPSSSTLKLGGGVSSDPLSTEVATKAFLQTWVEGLNSSGVWERVSHTVFEWCSVSWLKRATPTANWQTTPNSKVVSDSGAMKEFAKSPDDIDI